MIEGQANVIEVSYSKKIIQGTMHARTYGILHRQRTSIKQRYTYNIMDKYTVTVHSKGLLCCWTYAKASFSNFLVRSCNKEIVEVRS